MKLCIVGTRHGVTSQQIEKFTEYISEYKNKIEEIHLIDYTGCEEYFFNQLVHDEELKNKIILYIPENRKYRALCQNKIKINYKTDLNFRKFIITKCDFFWLFPHTYNRKTNNNCWSLYETVKTKKLNFLLFLHDGVVESK